jgi:hypothetical protein
MDGAVKHIGIVAGSAEGAALCCQTICRHALRLTWASTPGYSLVCSHYLVVYGRLLATNLMPVPSTGPDGHPG